MNNADYWARRLKIAEEAILNDAYKSVQEVERVCEAAIADCDTLIRAWYQRLAANNNVSYTGARKLLAADELEEFKWTVREYIKKGEENAISGEWAKQLENASARHHISKYEALKLQLQHRAELVSQARAKVTANAAKRAYADSYYHTAFEIQRGFGAGYSFGTVDDAMLDKMLAKPWTADGQTFSARIWGDRNKLVDTIQQELTRMLVTGSATPDKAIAAIASKFKTAKENAGRLVMTESSYFASIGQRDCYKELDVEQYQVVGTLDNGTCDKCSELDGQVFPMSAYQPGLTANPFHPWCRCCTAPYFADMEGVGERYARDIETGKAYAVPRGMAYKQWKDNQVHRMRANLPKGYVDRRKVGNSISSEELRLFAEKANRYGVKLSENLGDYGGFENYCGDPSVLDDVLERVKNNASGLTKHSKYDTIILKYTDILDASGRIDTETFAMVKGRTITLNRFMYDDTEYIQSEYAKLVAEGFFASGTDYRNVIDHEMGHIFAKYDKNAVSKVRNIVKRLAQSENMSYDDYVINNISEYASHSDEIIAELNAMRRGSNFELADFIWKEALNL